MLQHSNNRPKKITNAKLNKSKLIASPLSCLPPKQFDVESAFKSTNLGVPSTKRIAKFHSKIQEGPFLHLCNM